MEASDSDLLEKFAHERCDDAFTALVRRYLNLVYSAALRQVHSPQLAEDVAQSVFLDLARAASTLKTDSLLSAWLFQTTRRTAINTWQQESRRQLREQIAMELADVNSPESEWPQIAPLLDEAMESLNHQDRDALLLRFFEGKSLREVGARFGTSEDAAQKRVSRAIDQLREFFTQHGVSAGAVGLAALLSANAVQAAPVTLISAISSAAVSGAAISHASLAVKTLIMTTTQKILIASAAAIAIATGTYQALQVSELHTEVQQLRQQQKPMTEQIEQLRRERDENAKQLASAQTQIELFHREAATVPKLRGEVSRLATLSQKNAAGATNNPFLKMMNDPNFKQAMAANMRKGFETIYKPLLKDMHLTAEEEQKFYDLLGNDYSQNMDVGIKVLNGGNKEELGRERSASMQKLKADIETLLGEERFKQYKEFSSNRPYTAVVDGLKNKLDPENALTTEQSQQLFTIISEESKRVKGTTPDPDWSTAAGVDVDAQIERQKRINENVLNRASGILNVNQLEVFRKYRADGLDQLKTQLLMTRSLVGGQDSNAPSKQ